MAKELIRFISDIFENKEFRSKEALEGFIDFISFKHVVSMKKSKSKNVFMMDYRILEDSLSQFYFLDSELGSQWEENACFP